MFGNLKNKLNPLTHKKIEVRLVDDKVVLPTGPTAPAAISPAPAQNSAPVAEEGVISFNKRDLITAVVALTLVNGFVTVGLTIATNIYFDQEVAK